MSETDKIVSSMLADAKTAFLKQDWKELERICLMLGEFTNELNQIQKDKLVYYKNQNQEKLQ